MTNQNPTSDGKSREFDLVLFGATGFTGQLVAECLAKKRPSGLRWALAGRSRDKLARVRQDLLAFDARLAELPLLLADSADATTLGQLASRTRVIATTVGPYIKHGKPLLAACAAAGTHYCDITGEVQFVRWAIDEHNGRAQTTGARIVPTCGFDSIPSDLAVFLAHDALHQRGVSLADAKLSLEKISGAFSGGTVASMMEMLDELKQDRSLSKLFADPYALVPGRSGDPVLMKMNKDQLGVRWDAELQRWTAPFVMAAVNTRVVHRTNALLGFPYGKDFRYSEVMSFAKGPAGLLQATGLTAGIVSFLGLLSLGPTRALLKKGLPGPGEGPSREARTAGRAVARLLGHSAPNAAGATVTAQVDVSFPGDPGYSETAKLLAESALCLCEDELPKLAGILTPAACLGKKLIERLRARDQTWSVTTH